jgi:MFS family permease
MNAIPSPAANDARLTALVPLCLVVFFGFASLGLALGALPRHVHDTLGQSDVVVALVIAAQSLATLLTRQIAGRSADTHGGRHAMLIGFAIAAVAGFAQLATILTASPIAQLAMLVAARLALGVGESFLMTGALGWGMRRLGPAHSGRVMVWCGIAMYAAFAAGAPLGAWLLDHADFATVAAAALATPFAGLAFAASLATVAPAGGARLPFSRVVGLVARCGSGLALASIAFGATATFVTLMFAQRGWAHAGWSLTLFGAGYVGARLVGSGWPDRYGGARVALASLAVEALGQLLFWSATDPLQAHAGAVLTGIGFSLVFPAFGVEAVRDVPPASRASAMGAYVAFFDIALMAGTPIAGVVASHFGYRAVFLVGALAAGGSALVALGLLRRRGILAA